MQTLEYPLAFGQWNVRGDTLVCRMPRKVVTVAAPGPLLRAVQAACDGRTAWQQAAQVLARRWPQKPAEAFLADLAAAGVLVESAESLARAMVGAQSDLQPPRLAADAELPALPARVEGRVASGAATAVAPSTDSARHFTDLLTARRSHRTFDDAPVHGADLLSILWACQGVTGVALEDPMRWHRTIASGGNMHGARWFVLVLRPTSADHGGPVVEPGAYEAVFDTGGGTSLRRLPGSVSQAWRLLADPRVLRFASALVLPLLGFKASARKYGDRAALFALLEAGQSLQNAQLMATSLGVATVLRGDTLGAAVLEAVHGWIGAAACHGPVVAAPALVLGRSPTPAQVQLQQVASRVRVGPATVLPRQAVGRDRPFAFWAGPIVHGRATSYACGRSDDPAQAVQAAEAEAWERLGWATMGPGLEARACDLPSAVDPAHFIAYAPWQLASPTFPFRRHSSRRRHLWVQGTDVVTGRAAHLPAECVHALSALPQRLQAGACTATSSSGVAAFTDPQEALSRATLELLERDAVLRRWLAGKPSALVDLSTLPDAARRRIRGWPSTHRVAVSQFHAGPVPVYSVFVQSPTQPFVALTAAARFDGEAALDHALDEAEGRIAHALAAPAQPLASAAHVHTIEDLARFWQSRRSCRRADFYAAGPANERFGAPAEHARCWPELRDRLAAGGARLLAFDITPAGAALDQGRTPLHVVRAFVSGLLPAWFDAGLAPAGLAAFTESTAGASRRQRLFVHPLT
jgi:ribosomal protein S12 methylthiotransferase accessory factor